MKKIEGNERSEGRERIEKEDKRLFICLLMFTHKNVAKGARIDILERTQFPFS